MFVPLKAEPAKAELPLSASSTKGRIGTTPIVVAVIIFIVVVLLRSRRQGAENGRERTRKRVRVTGGIISYFDMYATDRSARLTVYGGDVNRDKRSLQRG